MSWKWIITAGLLLIVSVSALIWIQEDHMKENNSPYSAPSLSNCNLDYTCDGSPSQNSLCLIKQRSTEERSTALTIRIQGQISSAWEEDLPPLNNIVAEIICLDNPSIFRAYFMSFIRSRVSSQSEDKWSKEDMLAEEQKLLQIIEDEKEEAELRSKLMSEISKTYYYFGFNGDESKNLFKTSGKLLESKNDSLSLIGVSALVGPLADIDLTKSKEILRAFVMQNRGKIEEKPISFGAAITPFIYGASEDPEMLVVAQEICASQKQDFCRWVE